MGIKTVISALAFAVLNAGCALTSSREPIITMHADVQFTPPEHACVQWSADNWKYQTNGVADITLVWDYDSQSLKSISEHKKDHKVERWTSESPSAQINDDPEEGSFLLGEVQDHSGTMLMGLVVDRFEDTNMCKRVALHEFGHVLGIPHIDRKKTNIMYSYDMHERTACLKKDDLLGFCYFNNCGAIKMNPCEDQPDSVFGDD